MRGEAQRKSLNDLTSFLLYCVAFLEFSKEVLYNAVAEGLPNTAIKEKCFCWVRSTAQTSK
jgi:hypothetical protein